MSYIKAPILSDDHIFGSGRKSKQNTLKYGAIGIIV